MREPGWGRLSAAIILLALAGALDACDEPPPDPERRSKVDTPRVERLDPGLDAIVPGGVRIERVAGGFVFTEGPVWRERGGPHLLFSDLGGDAVYRWDPDGTVSRVATSLRAGEEPERFGPNGLTLDPQGRVVVCETGGRRISRLDDSGRAVLVDRYRDKRLNSPNDLVYRSDGSLYFTDPPHGLRGGDRDPAKELDVNGIYRLTPEGRVELLGAEQTRPNGIAFSPDEATLYVSNSDRADMALYAYRVRADGTIDSRRVFFAFTAADGPGLPDGVKVDRVGNVYVAGPGGVWVFAEGGRPLGRMVLPEPPTNLAWGDDGATLYVTAGSQVFRAALSAEGVRPDPAGATSRPD